MTHRFGAPLPRLLLAASLAGLLLLAAALILRAGSAPGRDDSSGPYRGSTGVARTGTPLASSPHRPNIVFVLTDDLSMDLLRYMPAVQTLAARGMTFNNYFVSDSLCCPSRASIFTGDFPHDTRVFTNNGPHGGMAAWIGHGDQRRTFNVALQKAGYRTAMMGKYINGYLEGARRSPVSGGTCRPAGTSGT